MAYFTVTQVIKDRREFDMSDEGMQSPGEILDTILVQMAESGGMVTEIALNLSDEEWAKIRSTNPPRPRRVK